MGNLNNFFTNGTPGILGAHVIYDKRFSFMPSLQERN